MRGGLTEGAGVGTGPTPARGTCQAAITAVAVVAALTLFISACSTGGTGARDEGPAHSGAVAATPAPSLASDRATQHRVDAIRLIKDDPQVAPEVKSQLKPCVADEYPVDVSYGDLTGDSADDLVVNVLTCSDVVGIGSYVYREENGRYENVFKAEETPVYAEIDRGELVVAKQVYAKGDQVSNPSGEYVITYRWSGSRFTARSRVYNEWSTVVGSEPTPVPESS